jgi:hypothetical protein
LVLNGPSQPRSDRVDIGTSYSLIFKGSPDYYFALNSNGM